MRRNLVLVGVIGMYAWLTFQRVHVWRSDEAIWTDAAKKAPCNPRPWANLAMAAERTEHVLAGKESLPDSNSPRRHDSQSEAFWAEAAKRAMMPCGSY